MREFDVDLEDIYPAISFAHPKLWLDVLSTGCSSFASPFVDIAFSPCSKVVEGSCGCSFSIVACVESSVHKDVSICYYVERRVASKFKSTRALLAGICGCIITGLWHIKASIPE